MTAEMVSFRIHRGDGGTDWIACWDRMPPVSADNVPMSDPIMVRYEDGVSSLAIYDTKDDVFYTERATPPGCLIEYWMPQAPPEPQ